MNISIANSNGENEMEEEKMISVYSINDVFSCCPARVLKMLRYKKEYILEVAEQFFSGCNCKDKIKEKYYSASGGWTCWETGAIALVATSIQQRHPEIRFKKLIHYCEYDQLIKLARELDDIVDVKTLLHVCQSKEEHKKFFGVIKESYDKCNGILPFFGYIKSKQEQQEEDDKKDYYRRREEERLKKQRIKKGLRSAFIAAGIVILAASAYLTF